MIIVPLLFIPLQNPAFMFYRFPTSQALAEYVVTQWIDLIHHKPKAVLGLATGSTMEPVYAHFIECIKKQNINLSELTTFNLDEYLGLGPDHPQSYHYYMQQHLFGALHFDTEKVCLPNGLCADVQQHCVHYSRQIHDLGGIDWQLLGIGTNGHIGFNEPGTSFSSQVHVVELSEQTRLDNSRFFEDKSQMPTQAITMGLSEIMAAKQVLLLATGPNKAQVMADLYHSPITENMPASILKQHPNAKILVDDAAAQLLPAAAFSKVYA